MEQKRREPGVQMEESVLPKSNITSSPCKVSPVRMRRNADGSVKMMLER